MTQEIQALAEEKEHDLKKINRLPIFDPANPTRKIPEKEEKWLREVSTYEFSNLEEPGIMLNFSYGSSGNTYKFSFFHGGKYKLPRFIAKYIESKATPIFEWHPTGTGKMRPVQTGVKSRFQMRELYS